MSKIPLRLCQILDDNGRWIDAEWGQVKPGTVFRAYDPNTGQPVYEYGRFVWVAGKDPYPGCGGLPIIDILIPEFGIN